MTKRTYQPSVIKKNKRHGFRSKSRLKKKGKTFKKKKLKGRR